MIAPPTCKLGDTLVFEGYADDYGEHIAAVEFSLDGGTSWTAFDTGHSAPDLMVRWTYSYEPTKSGRYQLKVRSVSDDGRRSPQAALAEFYVEDEPSIEQGGVGKPGWE